MALFLAAVFELVRPLYYVERAPVAAGLVMAAGAIAALAVALLRSRRGALAAVGLASFVLAAGAWFAAHAFDDPTVVLAAGVHAAALVWLRLERGRLAVAGLLLLAAVAGAALVARRSYATFVARASAEQAAQEGMRKQAVLSDTFPLIWRLLNGLRGGMDGIHGVWVGFPEIQALFPSERDFRFAIQPASPGLVGLPGRYPSAEDIRKRCEVLDARTRDVRCIWPELSIEVELATGKLTKLKVERLPQ